MNDAASDELDPVRKTRSVPIDPDEAFALFTARMDTWWPLEEHSVSGSARAVITFGRGAGTEVVESSAGVEHVWAEVLVHEPVGRVVLGWHPGGPPRPASRLDVRFTAVDDGTEVSVVHSGWESYGDAGPEIRRQYHVGWDGVLARYTEAARAVATY